MGRVFSRRLYIGTSDLKSPYLHIRLTGSLKEDLLVWPKFLKSFNSRSFFQEEFVDSDALQLFTGAAGL